MLYALLFSDSGNKSRGESKLSEGLAFLKSDTKGSLPTKIISVQPLTFSPILRKLSPSHFFHNFVLCSDSVCYSKTFTEHPRTNLQIA